MAPGTLAVQALFEEAVDGWSLAQTVVEGVREPLLILDTDLRIMLASNSFYRWFQLDPDNVVDRKLLGLDGGGWDIPQLGVLLQLILSENSVIEGCEISHEFPRIGRRVMLLHARRAENAGGPTMILIGFEDITERRIIEHEKERLKAQADSLLQQKEMLLAEMQHRIVNSLQIIASILMLKARGVTSDETRQHLQDAHRRVMSVAAVQQHLHNAVHGDLIAVKPYLEKLCASLSDSMIGESRPAMLEVIADERLLASADAVSLGLVVTELVINALKYAFPDPSKAATVSVRYDVNGEAWQLTVSDNGVGRRENEIPRKGGLGTSIVKALASQLEAEVDSTSGPDGMCVTVTHATFTKRDAGLITKRTK